MKRSVSALPRLLLVLIVANLATGSGFAFVRSGSQPGRHLATGNVGNHAPALPTARPTLDTKAPWLAHLKASTLRIQVQRCGKTYSGTGFGIGKNMILTNRHVVDGASKIIAITNSGTAFYVERVALSPFSDLAILEADHPLPNVLSLGSASSIKGTHTLPQSSIVTVAGYPLGGALMVTVGRVVNYLHSFDLDPNLDSGSILRVSAAAMPGSSGSPVVDERGTLIGVIFGVEKATTYALAVPDSSFAEIPSIQNLHVPYQRCIPGEEDQSGG